MMKNISFFGFFSVQLVGQQSDYIHTHTDLTIGCYYGELGVDLWSKEKWDIEFENHQVLVFTAQVFLNLIDHNFFCKTEIFFLCLRKTHQYSFSIRSGEFNHFR
jgi:endoribonuclease Dicer